MTGLEKIIKQIEDDAAASAAAVLEDAENQAFQIRQDAKVQGAVQGEETINRAKDEAKAMQERAASLRRSSRSSARRWNARCKPRWSCRRRNTSPTF